jgi:hypothetical protein
MLKFNALKTKDLNIQFSSSLAQTDFDLFLQILDGLIQQDQELYFSIKDLSKKTKDFIIKYKDGYKIISGEQEFTYSNFYDFVKKELGLDLNKQELLQRVFIVAKEEDSQNIKNLGLSIDLELEQEIQELTLAVQGIEQEIKSKLTAETTPTFERFKEINSKIQDLQVQIDAYQSEKDVRASINQNIDSLKKNKDSITQMLSSVSLLIKSRQDINSRLAQFHYSDQSKTIIQNLKQQKVQYLNKKLIQNPVQGNSKTYNQNTNSKSISGLSGSSMVTLLLFLTNLFGLIGFLYSGHSLIFLTLITANLLYIGVFTFLKFIYVAIEGSSSNSTKETINQTKEEELEDPNSQLFINSAWAEALNSELALIEKSMETSLKGKDYGTLESDLQSIEQELQILEAELKELDNNFITTDEYYKKRREVDILKIEKENVEFSLKIDSATLSNLSSNEAKLLAIKSKIENANFLKDRFPLFVKLTQNITIKPTAQIFSQVVLVKHI